MAAPTPAPSPSPRSPAPALQPTSTLIITWLAADEPPSTSQTIFRDAASCARARDAALAEGRRLASDAAAAFAAASAKFAAAEHHYIGETPLGGADPPILPAGPRVTAFCAASARAAEGARGPGAVDGAGGGTYQGRSRLRPSGAASARRGCSSVG